MKYLKLRQTIVLLILLPLLLTGCYNDWDYSGCLTEDNVRLRFRLLDADGDDLFVGKINDVDLLFFDEYGMYVFSDRVSRQELNSDNTLYLTVDPGTYYVVAWGNISDNATISQTNDESLANSYVEMKSADNRHPLYFSPDIEGRTRAERPDSSHDEMKVVVPGEGVLEKDMFFARAQRTINVYIEGIEHIKDYDGNNPSVVLTNQPFRYDFSRTVSDDRTNFNHTAAPATVSSSVLLHTTFNVAICDFEDDMTLHIRNNSDNSELVEHLELKKWVEENFPEDLNQIDILFTITKPGDGTQVDVSVTLVDWDKIDVKPGDF